MCGNGSERIDGIPEEWLKSPPSRLSTLRFRINFLQTSLFDDWRKSTIRLDLIFRDDRLTESELDDRQRNRDAHRESPGHRFFGTKKI
jgi:hypothetical protein